MSLPVTNNLFCFELPCEFVCKILCPCLAKSMETVKESNLYLGSFKEVLSLVLNTVWCHDLLPLRLLHLPPCERNLIFLLLFSWKLKIFKLDAGRNQVKKTLVEAEFLQKMNLSFTSYFLLNLLCYFRLLGMYMPSKVLFLFWS